MSTTPNDTTLEALTARVAALEQALASLQPHPSTPSAPPLASTRIEKPTGTRRFLRWALAAAASLVGALLRVSSRTALAAESSLPGTSGPCVCSSADASVPAVRATGTSGAHGVVASSDNGIGVSGYSDSGTGVYGQCESSSGVYGTSTSGYGVQGYSESSSGVGGISISGYGVSGQSESSSGVGGTSTSGYGVSGQSESNSGVYGHSTSGIGIQGLSDSSVGVSGKSESEIGIGVQGLSDSSVGVQGQSTSGTGVLGQSESESGVVGLSNSSFGIFGQSNSYFGVFGGSNSSTGVSGFSVSGTGVVGTTRSVNNYAGFFNGMVGVFGPLQMSGGGFQIDHPLDSAHKYLYSLVESPDMKNLYDGLVTLDANGQAEVLLPAWFETLNTDVRYQLTCLGGYAPVYIAEKLQHNRFTIAGGQTRMEVCWQVTGIRQDRWANAHRIAVEQDKPAQEQGYYLHPDIHGEPEEKSILHARYPDLHHPVLPQKSRRSS
jgi:hypothetical protein